MMPERDVLKRLVSGCIPDGEIGDLTLESADEIRRLREELAAAKKQCAGYREGAENLGVEMKAIEAERDRLRETLERLGSMEALVSTRAVKLPEDVELIARIDFARAALVEEK